MAPTAAFLVLLALLSDPFCFHQNGIIWALKAPLLTLRWPFLVIAACSHISYAGNTHNNLTSSNLPQSRPFQAASEDDDAMLVRKQGEPLHPRTSHTGTLASTKETNTERGGGGGIHPKIKSAHYQRPNIWRISTSEVGNSI